MFRSKLGLTLLVALVFGVNVVETAVEQHFGPGAGRVSALGYRFAYAMKGLETQVGLQAFTNHDATHWLSVYGYSISYFFLFPLLCIGVALALILRREISGYRVLCLAAAIDYILSLAFFVFMPVPERWAFPDSGAIMLSDLWSSGLIESIRPISGLDNCFPSTHTSFTVILILVCFRFRVRMRLTVLIVGLSVILATFVLGVHWLPDIVAGVTLAWLSLLLAQVLENRIAIGSANLNWRPVHA